MSVSVAIFEPLASDDVGFVHGNQRYARATSVYSPIKPFFTGQCATGSARFSNSKRPRIARRKLSVAPVSDPSHLLACAERLPDLLQSCLLCSRSSSPRAIVSRVCARDNLSSFFARLDLVQGLPFTQHSHFSPHLFIMEAFNYGITEWGSW